jgi:lipoprotein-anchoring transpeptidase ErfK/SrfK
VSRAIRIGWLAVLTAVLAVAGSVATGTAAIAPPTPAALASIQPANGAVVGVAHPVIVTFTGPVRNRAAAERAIKISTPNHISGRFDWVETNVVEWKPDGYWPAHSHVGVEVHALSTGFDTGDQVVGVASISAHTFTVSVNGEVLRTMPASMGKPSRPTPMGNYSALSKERTVVMDSRTIGIPLVRRIQNHRLVRRSCHLEWRLCAFGAVVGGLAGLCERQPRLHQPQPGQRRLVLRHRAHR